MKDTIILYQNNENLKLELISLFRHSGFDVLCAKSGEEAVSLTLSNMPSIVIISHDEKTSLKRIIKKIRKFSAVPIFAAEETASEKERAEAFECGADDFILPPVLHTELPSRIKRAICRFSSSDNSSAEHYAAYGLDIDFSSRIVRLDGKEIYLTPVEYKITELLCKHSGKVLTHEYIMKNIWGPYVPLDNKILRVNITNIRKKIEREPSTPFFIKTVSGIGYSIIKSTDKIQR